LIGSASVDEISLVFDPGNPDAIIHPTPAAIQFYDLAIRGVGLIQQAGSADEAGLVAIKHSAAVQSSPAPVC